MKKIIPLLFILFLACQTKPGVISYVDERTGEIKFDTIPFNDLRDYPFIQSESDPTILIQAIAVTNCFHGKYIGIVGTYSKQYARFERLTKILDEKEFFDLTKHENPVVRLYGFKGLKLVDSRYLDQARAKMLIDTTQVCCLRGCRMTNSSVSFFVTKKGNIRIEE